MSAKKNPKGSSEEFFFEQDGEKQDADLHNAILDQGNHEEAEAVSARVRKRILARARKQKAWDEGKHPRVPAGSPEGGQFGEGGGEGEPKDTGGKRFLVGHAINDETLRQWQDQTMAEAAKLEPGSAKDDELNKMMGALGLYGRMKDEFKSGGSRTISTVYDLDKKLLAIVASSIDRETGVAEVTFGGGTDPDAMVKALQLTIASHEKEAERIEATDWANSFNNESFIKAGFRREGEPSYGVQTFVWGSAGPTKGQLAKIARETREHAIAIEGASKASARLLGYDPKLVKVSDEDHAFKIGDETTVRHAAGTANLVTGEITMYPKYVWSTDAAVSVMAHEVGHQRYETVRKAFIAERSALMKEPGPPPDPNAETLWGRQGGFHAVMSPDGTPRPPYDEKYPLYARMQKHEMLSALEKRVKSDGITDYSRAYWEQAKPEVPTEKRVSWHLAQHETIAEMASRLTDTGKLEGKPEWRSYYRDIDKSYNELKAKEKK